MIYFHRFFLGGPKNEVSCPRKVPLFVGAVNLIKSCYIILKTTLLHTTMIRPSSETNLMKIGVGGVKIEDYPHILATVGGRSDIIIFL
jgi:hypothetical protein